MLTTENQLENSCFVSIDTETNYIDFQQEHCPHSTITEKAFNKLFHVKP